MASCGRDSVRVFPRPRVAVITTGTELIPPGQTLAPAQIRDSNGPMLVVMARDMGLEPPEHRHADDRLESLLDALDQSSSADIILLTGGVSVGNYDLVPKALEEFGATTIFHKVRQKPGKPFLLARKDEQLFFGLPGNPLASHFCFHRYVAAAVRRMEGKPPVPGSIFGELAEPVGAKRGRTYFVTARAVRCGDMSSKWRIHALPSATSADIFASAMANCYVEIPPGAEPVPEGKTLPFTWIGNAPWPH